MTNWGYKAVRKVLQTFGGAELAQQQSGRITGEPGNPEVAALARRAGAESCVLLKNNNHALPLDLSAPVALFGRVQKNYFYVGNGSGGDVSAPYSINLVQGLVNAGVQLDSTVLAAYESWCTASVNDPDPGFWGHWPRYYAEMPVKQDWVQAAAKRCQTAVVVIGRSAGEDRENTLKKGSFYLTNKEKALLDAVTTAFQKVVLVLNIGSIMDFAEIDAYGDKISAILLAWQLGMESGNAVTDVLTGQVNPSGRLTDTIAKTYADYPAQNFGNKAENRYTEDIFVGYRYFETFAPERVLYPFGYGLSYTDFACKVTKTETKDQTVTVQVQVENTGALPGKQVVQLYACCPCGALGKAAKVLIAFCKTEELAPGKHQSLTLTAPYRHFASFDDSGAAGHKNAWLLEAGDYTFCLGTDVRSAVPCGDLHLADTLVLEQCCELLAPPADSGFDRLTATVQNDKVTQTYAPVPTATVDLKQEILDHLPVTGNKGFVLADVAEGSVSLDDFVAQLSTTEMELLSRGEGMMDSPLGASGNAGAMAGVSDSLRQKGIPPVITTDGPSGIRLRATCSLLPSGTALACSWNLPLVQDLYAAMGREMVDKGTDVLLAPGINIHRNPLCGRNFEYFSEDPLVTGKLAAAVVQGLQSAPVSACPKHFACNNQEYNRNYNNSVVSARALREIYLRGFEICVKEAHPKNLMTSYNKINGVWSHYNYQLCTALLREEWGYTGNVMTDWWMRYAPSPEFPELRDNGYRVRAQVDVLMPGAKTAISKSAPNDGSLLATLGKPDGITLGELQRTAKNVLRMTLRTKFAGQYKD
jgi:beta-glucosidase